MNKVHKIIINIMISILMTILSLYILLNIFIPRKTIDIIGFNFYNVSSTSMVPKYKVNDVIFVSRTNKSRLEVGDIITFISNIKEDDEIKKVIITHYIGNIKLENNETIYQTQSHINYKNSNNYDTWYSNTGEVLTGIASNDILGKAQFKIPYLGYINTFLKNPIVYITISGIIIFIFIGKYHINRNKKEIKSEEES